MSHRHRSDYYVVDTDKPVTGIEKLVYGTVWTLMLFCIALKLYEVFS